MGPDKFNKTHKMPRVNKVMEPHDKQMNILHSLGRKHVNRSDLTECSRRFKCHCHSFSFGHSDPSAGNVGDLY